MRGGALLRQLLALLIEQDDALSRVRQKHSQALLNALVQQLCHGQELSQPVRDTWLLADHSLPVRECYR
jgi:hypothetical protein